MHFTKNRTLLFILMALFTIGCQTEPVPSSWEVTSPNERLSITMFLQEEEQDQYLFYQVDLIENGRKTNVIRPSKMGIERKDAAFLKGLKFVNSTAQVTIDTTYTLPTGKQTTLRNNCTEQAITFERLDGKQLQVVLRAYDDAGAFRYRFPETSDELYTVEGEHTEFAVPPTSRAWIQPYDSITPYTPAYEKYYLNDIAADSTSPNTEGWAFPALFQAGSNWLLLTEAGSLARYFGAHLQPRAPKGVYSIRLPEYNEAMNTGPAQPSGTLPWATPWRVIIAGKDLNTIATSNVVRHLNPPTQPMDFSWVNPGRVSWSWWSDHPSSKDFQKLKSFIDLAAVMGWEYSLVDANWNIMEGGNIEQLIEYANSKGVGILMWYNSGGAHNTITEQPRDIMSDPVRRKEEFAKLQQWGVKGIKVDFFQSDKPHIIQQYHDILKDAAKHQIMVNFHGCTIPRGWSRTWPNLMTMESVSGAECYSFRQDYPENAPIQNTILPVTRNVLGSMDFTPVTFSDQTYPHLTTYGHELALSVLFESGWLHMADRVAAYQGLPQAPKDFLQSVPVAWDNTRYVVGMPGLEMVMARLKDGVWYVAGVNGENEAKTIRFPLNFLGSSTYTATYIGDGDTPTSFNESTATVSAGATFEAPLLPFGGFVLKLSPTEKAL